MNTFPHRLDPKETFGVRVMLWEGLTWIDDQHVLDGTMLLSTHTSQTDIHTREPGRPEWRELRSDGVK
jgi:hypothetical protein